MESNITESKPEDIKLEDKLNIEDNKMVQNTWVSLF